MPRDLTELASTVLDDWDYKILAGGGAYEIVVPVCTVSWHPKASGPSSVEWHTYRTVANRHRQHTHADELLALVEKLHREQR